MAAEISSPATYLVFFITRRKHFTKFCLKTTATKCKFIDLYLVFPTNSYKRCNFTGTRDEPLRTSAWEASYLTVPLSPLSIINTVDVQGGDVLNNIFFCENSLCARYIRNALVGMAYFSWQIFALHSHCIRISFVQSLRSKLGSAVGARQSISVSERC